MFKRILVPTDGCKLSQKAVKRAIELAKITHAKLEALHVLPRFLHSHPGVFGAADGATDTAYDREMKVQAQRLFTGIGKQADAAGVELEAVLIENNDVWRAIIAVATRKNCDLICMASHGRHGLSGVILGSETSKVLTHSSIPVLVIR